MLRVWMSAVVIAGAASAAQAQPPSCTPAVQTVQAGSAVVRPEGFSAAAAARFLRSDGTSPPNSVANIATGVWSREEAERLSTLAGGDPLARLVWSDGGRECSQTLNLPTPAQGVQGAQAARSRPSSANAYRENECEIAGADWRNRLLPQAGRRAATVLLFDQDGQLCYPPPARPTQGDPIYVGVFTNRPQEWSRARITFDPCSLEPASPNVLSTGQLPTLSQLQAGEADWVIEDFPVRQCWNAAVAINITAQSEHQISYSLVQATKYRATLHLGTVFTESHDTTFGLRPDGAQKRIFAQGPVDRGPEYVAALAFYSVLRYLPPLGGRPSYPGRDPVADNGFADKLGAVIGVGLRHPTKRFIFGGAFEIAAGVNLLGVWDWGQENVLRGVAEGDVFTGAVEEIPVVREWRSKFVFGVSMDLVYATNAFRR